MTRTKADRRAWTGGVRRRSAALLALLAVAGGGWSGAASAQTRDAVAVWLTTADQKQLLAPQPELRLGSGRPAEGARIDLDPGFRGQTIVGFGASVTDSSAWLIQNRMSPAQREALLTELFGPSPGLGLSFTRMTIGASDFSLSHYSLADTVNGAPDPKLARFSIDPVRKTVVPVVKRALAINPRLKVMASPWSPPGWMKTGGSMIGGTLKPEYEAVYADYFRLYIEEHARAGVPVHYLSIQNEPDYSPANYPGMRWPAADRARFIGDHLGPLLERRGIDAAILEWDHNWDRPEQPLAVLADPEANRYVKGVAWHCYGGHVSVQTAFHAAYPDKDTFETECSGGDWNPGWAEPFQSTMRNLIIGATRGWARGVLLWNLALDENKGPYKGGCDKCRGVVTIDSRTGAVTRNLEYYALAHASRFVRPGAVRIGSEATIENLPNVAFRNADDGSTVLLVLNATKDLQTVSVRSPDGGFAYALPVGAAATFVWKPGSATR